MFAQNGMDGSGNQWPMQQMQPQMPQADAVDPPDMEEGDNAHRPPNAFILYSQAMRSQARQENPSLSNTEVSRLLGKMWKEVPNEIKLQYKQKAAAMQEEFKREHPDYTYRKARRKRALNELLTKSSTGFPGFPAMAPNGAPFAPGEMSQFQQMPQNFQMPFAPQPTDQNGGSQMYNAQGMMPPMNAMGMHGMSQPMQLMPGGMSQTGISPNMFPYQPPK